MFKFVLLVDVVFTRNTEACGLLVMTGTLEGKKEILETTLCFWTANAYDHNIIKFLWIKVLNEFIKYINIDEIKYAISAVKLGGLLAKWCPVLVNNVVSLRLFSAITKINL